MADIDNFRQLLQYFVAHLEFCNANLLIRWNGKNPPTITDTRGFNDFIRSYFINHCNGNWKHFKRSGTNKDKIQDQIKDWAILSCGKIGIGINATGPYKYKSNTNFLNWINEWSAIRVKKWNGDKIESLVITNGETGEFREIGTLLMVGDNLYDNTDGVITNNTQELIGFWDTFRNLKSGGDPVSGPSSKPGKDVNQTPKTSKTAQEKHPLNLILYGPPGTGKTYSTLYHTLAIIENRSVDEVIREKEDYDIKGVDGYKKLKEVHKYDELVKSGQIMFTTFHQSMSYEDFIEGIKPIPPQDKDEQMVYNVEDGIFKQICEKAKKITVKNKSAKIDFSKTRVFKLSLGEKGKDADSVFEYCVENEVIALGWGGSKDFSKCKTKADFQALDSSWGATALERFKEVMKKDDIVLVSDGLKEIKGIAQVVGEYEYRDDSPIDMHQFRTAKWLYTGDNFLVSKLYDKSLSKQSIYCLYDEKKVPVDKGGIKVDILNDIITGEINDKKEDNYVLIIDEINRGNVAQIFGELITLIEPSKRWGNDKVEKTEAILPYSSAQEGKNVYFSVPDNLYIIGTMNTADRSVEALDTALRRRFSFEEMMPNPKLLSKIVIDKGDSTSEIDLGILLETINKRIVVLKDREHQIGHSYFMGHDEKDEHGNEKYPDKKVWLRNVFKNKIIPLLQEYFYGDYKKIYYVLGPGFVVDSFKGKNADKIRQGLFPFVTLYDQDLDIPEEKFEIKDFNNGFDISDAIDALIGNDSAESTDSNE